MVRGFQRQLFPVWAYALLLLGMLCGAMTAQAGLTPAGTPIKNLATVTYQDTLGNKFTAQSNESVVTVAEIHVADLTKDQLQKEGTPGQTVYFPHQLSNSGNKENKFNLTVNLVDESGKIITIPDAAVAVHNDINGNGQVDANEPVVGSDFEVKAGDTANLVVAVKVPAAMDSGTIKAKVVATAVAGTPFTGENATDNGKSKSNTDTVLITTNQAVLHAIKSVIRHKPASVAFDQDGKVTQTEKGTVEYKIEITNNGSKLAEAEIYDFLPKWLDGATVERSGDIDSTRIKDFGWKKDADSSTVLLSGTKLSDNANGKQAVYAKIENLEKGKTSIQFTVKYSAVDQGKLLFNENDLLKNKAFIVWKDKQKQVETNETRTALPGFYNLEVLGYQSEDGIIKDDGKYIGSEHKVKSASQGGIVSFTAQIKNLSNGSDSYTLSVDKGTFTDGTTFSFWKNAEHTLPFADSRTSSVEAGDSIKVFIKAQLPDELNATDVKANLHVVSVKDFSKTGNVALILGDISGSQVDLSFFEKVSSSESDEDSYKDEKAVLAVSAYRKEVELSFWVRNESGTSRTFPLFAYDNHNLVGVGKTRPYDKKSATKLSWEHKFYNEAGTVITTTEQLPPQGSQKIKIKVVVPVNESPGAKLFSVLAGNDEVNDALKFSVEVKQTIGLLLTPPRSENQIEAGGTVSYMHTLKNTSNDKVTVKIWGDNTLEGWDNRVLSITVPEGIEAPESEVEKIDEKQKRIWTVKLPAGKSVDINLSVISPANAMGGEKDTFTLTARAENGENVVTVKAEDITTVIKGQIRLHKKAAVLKGVCKRGKDGKSICRGTTDESKKDGLTFSNDAGEVVPGEDYVVWQIIATNVGDAPATQVTIRDAAPAYTAYISDSACVVKNDENGVVSCKKDQTNGKVISASDAAIVFNVGDGATDTSDGSGGTLQPGQSVEVRFTVKVN